MAREKVFEETFTVSTVEPEPEPDTNFFLEEYAFDPAPIRGETVGLSVWLNEQSPTDRTYYVTAYADGGEVADLGGVFVNPTDGGMEIPLQVAVPDASSFELMIEGGYDDA